jgi:hypothetical protein
VLCRISSFFALDRMSNSKLRSREKVAKQKIAWMAIFEWSGKALKPIPIQKNVARRCRRTTFSRCYFSECAMELRTST